MTTMDLSTAIVSSIPGRLRLRHPLLRRSAQSIDWSARLGALDGVLSVEANPRTGSLLVHYDVSRCGRAAMEAQITGLGESSSEPEAADTIDDSPSPSRRATAREWNRLAKLGMMASFPVSLALAATGSKKLHAVTGGVFSLLLLAHLVVHRRHLLK